MGLLLQIQKLPYYILPWRRGFVHLWKSWTKSKINILLLIKWSSLVRCWPCKSTLSTTHRVWTGTLCVPKFAILWILRISISTRKMLELKPQNRRLGGKGASVIITPELRINMKANILENFLLLMRDLRERTPRVSDTDLTRSNRMGFPLYSLRITFETVSAL